MSRALTVIGWLALALVLLLAAGGAAARPEGIWLGFPGVGALALVAVALGALAWWSRGAAGPALAGLGLIPVLLLSGAPLPGLGGLSGPPLAAAGLAGVALVFAVRPPEIPRLAFLPIVALVYLGAAARAQLQVGPSGDEPHYLMVADSLLRDGDVALSRDYAEGRYHAFFDGHLEPHYRVRGKGGEIYSVHAVGLSALVLPAYALGGYPAVSFFMALLAAWLAREVRELVREVSGRDQLADGMGWLLALSPPLIHYAGLVFTEVPAALAVALGLRHGRRLAGPGSLWAVGAALALLPWLHVRYAALSVVLALYVLAGRPRLRPILILAGVGLASALGLAAYHLALYGTPDPRVVWGRRPEFALAALPVGLQGLLLDQEFGLLVYAPVLVLSLPGLVGLVRAARRTGAAAVGLLLVVFVTAGAWHMWRGGWNPPARFLVPVLPVMALGLAMTLRRGLGAAAALLVGWGLWTGLAGAWEPRLIHRDRDGTAPFFRAFSGAEEWTRLLPGFVLDESRADRGRSALVWGAALAAAAAAALRTKTPPGALRVGAAALFWLTFTGAASSLSRARTGGRDAVRLIGRPALNRLWFERRHEARWGPEALAWGPAYEPHRHPRGVEVGSRLPLPPGNYELELAWDDLGGGTVSGWLEVRGDSGIAFRQAFTAGFGGPRIELEVPPGEKAVSLVVGAGSPFLLKEIRLAVQPSTGGPV